MRKPHSEETKKKIGLAHIGNKWNLGKKLSEEAKRKIGDKNRGRKHTEEQNRKHSEMLTGRKNPHAGVKRSDEAKKKIAEYQKTKNVSIETRKKLSIANSGSNCTFWKGGITKDNLKVRMTLEYRLWRTSVFERDNYTCVSCNKVGGKLNADHIKSFSAFPELRFSIDNGRTLCEECHRKTPNFGWRAVWMKDGIELPLERA